MRGLLILITLVLINLPVVGEWRTEREISADGRDVLARVTKVESVGGRNFVTYRLPADADPRGLDWSAAIDDEAAALAEESDRIEVRYVPGEPSSNRPVGEVENRLVVVAAVIADVILLLIAALLVARHWPRREDPPSASDATDQTA